MGAGGCGADSLGSPSPAGGDGCRAGDGAGAYRRPVSASPSRDVGVRTNGDAQCLRAFLTTRRIPSITSLGWSIWM
jgi:hypothetical protein